MHALGFHGVVGHCLVFFLLTLGQVGHVLKFRQFGCDVGEYEELRVLVAVGEYFVALVGKFHRAVFLVDYEI